MKTIPLTRGKYAIVDDEDYEWLSHWKWTYGSHGYAIRSIKTKGSWTHELMHRVILKAPEAKEPDHINGNKLDNRRKNLRLCTSAQNKWNLRVRHEKKKTSRFKGVYLEGRSKRWRARVQRDYKVYYAGLYKTEIEAAKAYNQLAQKLFGEFAWLNPV